MATSLFTSSSLLSSSPADTSDVTFVFSLLVDVAIGSIVVDGGDGVDLLSASAVSGAIVLLFDETASLSNSSFDVGAKVDSATSLLRLEL